MADTQTKSRQPSVMLLIMGLAALGVSGWALLGPGTFHWLTTFDGRWYLVAGAAVVGLALVLAPTRRRRG